MARIRTIKPEFAQSESIGRLSREARLLFVLLWTICDDYGRCRAAIQLLAGQLYPYDDDAAEHMPAWLEELQREGMVNVYQVDRATFLEVSNWSKHQRVDNAGKSHVPPPSVDGVADTRGDSPRLAENLGDSRLDLGPRTSTNNAREAREQNREPAAETKPKPTDPAPSPDRPPDVAEQAWADWCRHRRTKRSTVTQTALDGIRREAELAGISLSDALTMSVANGWQGFRASWLQRGKPAGASHHPQASRHRSELDLGDPACSCTSCCAVRRDRGTA